MFLKIILIISITLLFGCNKPTLESDELNVMEQPTYANYLSVASTDEAMYFVVEPGQLYAYEKDGSFLKIANLYYIDDKEIDDISKITTSPKKYTDMVLSGTSFQKFDNHLLYASMYDNVEGNIEYHLNCIDFDGSNRKELVNLEFEPKYFLLHKDKMLVVESKEKDVLHIYDLSGKEITTLDLGGTVYNLIGDGDLVFVVLGGQLVEVSLNNYEKDIVSEGEAYVCESSGLISSYTIDDSSNMMTSYIKDYRTNEVKLTLENHIIDYFNDEFIYATTVNEEHTKYHIYDWNGQLIKEVIPYNSLGESTEGAMPIALNDSEYSTIVRIWQNQIIGSCYGNQGMRYFSCDIDSGSCKYIVS